MNKWTKYVEGCNLPLSIDSPVWVTIEYLDSKHREVVPTWWHGNMEKDFVHCWKDGKSRESVRVIAWMKREIPEVFKDKE